MGALLGAAVARALPELLKGECLFACLGTHVSQWGMPASAVFAGLDVFKRKGVLHMNPMGLQAGHAIHGTKHGHDHFLVL